MGGSEKALTSSSVADSPCVPSERFRDVVDIAAQSTSAEDAEFLDFFTEKDSQSEQQKHTIFDDVLTAIKFAAETIQEEAEKEDDDVVEIDSVNLLDFIYHEVVSRQKQGWTDIILVGNAAFELGFQRSEVTQAICVLFELGIAELRRRISKTSKSTGRT